jgi:hypothetical protein
MGAGPGSFGARLSERPCCALASLGFVRSEIGAPGGRCGVLPGLGFVRQPGGAAALCSVNRVARESVIQSVRGFVRRACEHAFR